MATGFSHPKLKEIQCFPAGEGLVQTKGYNVLAQFKRCQKNGCRKHKKVSTPKRSKSLPPAGIELVLETRLLTLPEAFLATTTLYRCAKALSLVLTATFCIPRRPPQRISWVDPRLAALICLLAGPRPPSFCIRSMSTCSGFYRGDRC
jgi:hypothetical protein